MLSTLRNAWKVTELRNRIIFTIIIIAFFRLGNNIPVPGVSAEGLAAAAGKAGSLLGFFDLINGGAFSKASIFAMGVIPYINASIIMQLLTIAIPQLEQLSKEGEDGRKKISNYTRYLAIVLAVLQAFGQYAIISNLGAIQDGSKFNLFVIVITLTTASIFLMWLGEQITVKGIGNGVSMLIFVNIVSRIPFQIKQVASLQSGEQISVLAVVIFILILAALFVAVVMMSLAERRIPVQYAGKVVGNKTFKGQSSHIPINMNASGVIAIIFAMSVMQFPATIAQFFPKSGFATFVQTSPWSVFKQDSWKYAVFYFVLILFFTWFYTLITFKPDEMAENMHKSSGFIPGVRPGEYTARYIESVLGKISLFGGTFAGIIATFPMLVAAQGFQGLQLQGTTLLIVVGVALETARQLESQLVMRHYQGFLK